MTSNLSSYAPPPSVWDELKEELKRAAPEMGIDDIGFASADPFVSLKSILQNHRDKGYESGFEEPDLDKRTTPSLTGAEPASIIAIAVAYPSKMSNPPKSEPGKYRGIMARSAWGRDYHVVLREAMAKLEDFIRERVPDAILDSMVDTGALVDRAVAERAGIGFSAKNCSIISPKFGSWIYLGEMVTNIPFPPDTPVTEDCGECTKCIDACPTGALVGPGQLNAQRCVSFLTQTKGFVEEEDMRKIGNRLYGCDTCQIVCPKNKGLNWSHHPELQPDPEKAKPLLLPILDMSNREFKEAFGDTSAAWRGKKPIQRNAVIALGNFRDASAVPKLGEILLNDPRPELRGTAAWALGRIGGEEALRNLEKGYKKEQDEQVRSLLRNAFKQLSGLNKGSQTTEAAAAPAQPVPSHEEQPESARETREVQPVMQAEEHVRQQTILHSATAHQAVPTEMPQSPGTAAEPKSATARADVQPSAASPVMTPQQAAQPTAVPQQTMPQEPPQPAVVEPEGFDPMAPKVRTDVLYFDEVDTPIGTLTVVMTNRGVSLVEFGAFTVIEAVLQQWSRTWAGDVGYVRDEERLADVIGQLNEYFAGRLKTFTVPLDMRGTPFQQQVWEVLKEIPYGQLRSYKDISNRIGRPKAVRAVGGANNKNPVPIIVPCHRVVGADGSLVGYGGGLEIKKTLLSMEGSLPERRGL